MLVSFIAVLLSILAVVIGVIVFRDRKKHRKIVILGERQTGKTRLFVYLSRKEVEGTQTLPTMEVYEEQVTPTVTLVDTPGGTTKSIQKSAEDLAPGDLILFLYNRKSTSPPKNIQARMVRIYTGDGDDTDADYSIAMKEKNLAYDKLSQLASSLF